MVLKQTEKPSPLRRRRLELGLSLERLAVQAGLTRPTVTLAERAPFLASERTKRALAQVLGVPPEELFP